MNTDYVYYVASLEGDLLSEAYSSRTEAESFAEESNIETYTIIEWSVD